ncbi:MAG: MATE family efflux transporter [Eubacteriales bacterium]|nr:MATE family efflux transporter [Eubacteriales bacterium]
MRNKKVDLLKGPVTSSIVRLAVPIMAGSFLSLAYSLTDMFWVGRLGTQAVAAVGTGGLLMWVSDGILSIMRIGGQVHCGQSYGSGQIEEVRCFGREALRLGFLASLLLFVTYFFAADPIISIFNFNEISTHNDSIIYLRVASFGLFATYSSRIMSSLLTPVGNSKSPFMANAIGLIVNMILDPLMIITLGMGVFGAGLATVIAQFIVMLILIFVAKKDDIFNNLKLFTEPVAWNNVREILRIGLPAGVQSLIRSTVTIVISRMVVRFGDLSIAVQRFGSQVESISWLTADGFGSAVSAFVSQNYGAGQGKRMKHGYRSASVIVFIICVFTTAILYFFAADITALFMNEPDAIAGGRDYLQILSASQILMGLEIITIAAFSALGQTRFTAVVSTIFIGARIPLSAWLSSTSLGVNGIWWTMTITTNVVAVVFIAAFFSYMRKLEREEVIDFS